MAIIERFKKRIKRERNKIINIKDIPNSINNLMNY